MVVLVSSRRYATHQVLVESKRGGDYKSFSVFMPPLRSETVKEIMLETIEEAIGLLSDEFRTGPDNDKHTHKIRMLISRKLEPEQRYVMSKNIHKPYHSSEEVVVALKTVLKGKGYYHGSI